MGRRLFSQKHSPEISVWALALNLSNLLWQAGLIDRTQAAQVVALVHTPTCLTNALVAHFGEERSAPCGHCSSCNNGHRVSGAGSPLGRPTSGARSPGPELPPAERRVWLLSILRREDRKRSPPNRANG